MLLATGPEFHARVLGGELALAWITRSFQTFVGDRLWILSSSASLHEPDYTLEGAAITVPPCFPLCQAFDMFVIFPAPLVSPSLEVASTVAPCFTEASMPGWSFTSSTAFWTSFVSSRWHTGGLAPTELEVMLGFLMANTAPYRIWTLRDSSTFDCGGFAGLFQPMPSAGSFSRRVSRGLLRHFHCMRSPFCLLCRLGLHLSGVVARWLSWSLR